MKRNTTTEKTKKIMKRNQKVVAPSNVSLNLLRAFARVYYVEKKIEEPLNNVFVN